MLMTQHFGEPTLTLILEEKKLNVCVDHVLSDEENWNEVMVASSPLAVRWKQLSGFMGLISGQTK